MSGQLKLNTILKGRLYNKFKKRKIIFTFTVEVIYFEIYWITNYGCVQDRNLSLCSRYDLVKYDSFAIINSLSAFNKTIFSHKGSRWYLERSPGNPYFSNYMHSPCLLSSFGCWINPIIDYASGSSFVSVKKLACF